MTIARRHVVDRSAAGWYHCVNRCVRRAFLCGGEFEHRRDWVRSRLIELSGLFAVDVAAYAVMSNHFHVVVHVSPACAREWSAEDVASRWLRLFRGRKTDGDDRSFDLDVQRLVADAIRIEVLRARLADLSWFMRCLSEPIARRANREDGCTGRFWEGRFKCRRLLDQRAVIACCVYADLNPIRAGMARTPEDSDYTSIRDRIRCRQQYEKLQKVRSRSTRRAARPRRQTQKERLPRHAEDGIWLVPMTRRRSAGPLTAAVGISIDVYLALVDTTGRLIRSGKHGAIPEELRRILERLEIDAEGWTRSMLGLGRRFGTAVGSTMQLAREALRRGSRWIVKVFDVHGQHEIRTVRSQGDFAEP